MKSLSYVSFKSGSVLKHLLASGSIHLRSRFSSCPHPGTGHAGTRWDTLGHTGIVISPLDSGHDVSGHSGQIGMEAIPISGQSEITQGDTGVTENHIHVSCYEAPTKCVSNSASHQPKSKMLTSTPT